MVKKEVINPYDIQAEILSELKSITELLTEMYLLLDDMNTRQKALYTHKKIPDYIFTLPNYPIQPPYIVSCSTTKTSKNGKKN